MSDTVCGTASLIRYDITVVAQLDRLLLQAGLPRIDRGRDLQGRSSEPVYGQEEHRLATERVSLNPAIGDLRTVEVFARQSAGSSNLQVMIPSRDHCHKSMNMLRRAFRDRRHSHIRHRRPHRMSWSK